MSKAINIKNIQVGDLFVPLVGMSRLVVNRFDNKIKQELLDKHIGKSHKKKEHKDPEALFKASRYLNADGEDCFPAIGFKASMISAARYVDGVAMTEIRGALFIPTDLVRIYSADGPCMRQDIVRLKGSTADVRIRAGFEKWWAVLPIEYNKQFLTEEQVVNLLNIAGFGVGIGEYRPEKSGEWGRFRVADDQDMHLFEGLLG